MGNRDTSPLHHRSHRDISRELSPRRRRLEEEDEERKDRESSRVRRDNLLPNYFADNRSELSSGSSLTGFNHKVDRQLEETCAKYADDRRSACRTPLSHPYESRTTATRHSHTDPVQIPTNPAGSATATDSFPGPCRHIASRTIPTIGPLVVPVAHPSISPASWRSATPPSPQPSTIGSSLRSRSSGRPTPVRPVVRQWFHPRCQPKAMSNCAAPPQAHPAPPLPAPPPPHSCPAAMQASPFRCPRPATFPI